MIHKPIPLTVKLLTEHAKAPCKATVDAAGYDLFASEDTVVPKHGKALVPTGISISMPQGCYGRIAPRSGLAWKKHIDVGAGVIDRDYRGPVGIVLFNHSNEDLPIVAGDRVAQLILERIYHCPVQVVSGDLDTTERGQGGFGSTGN